MRFLIITQYFPPETGAPQNRLFGLAKEMKKKGEDVVVLTAMPNYPQMKIHPEYKGKFFVKEILEGIDIYRSWIYTGSKNSIFSRLLNYFSFVKTSWIISFKIKGRFDYVICESPPLFTGISAVLIARRKKAKLIFNVSDLWPESAEKLGLVRNKFFLRLAYRLEKWLYYSSVLVTGQTKGICENISGRFPSVKVHWLPNGIDENRFDPNIHSDWRIKNGYAADDFIILYAGIIGHAQGLECIIHAANKIKEYKSIKFVLLGDGPEREKLIKISSDLGLSNIRFFEGVPGYKIPGIIKDSDVAVVPLKKLDLFKGAIPSKIFENIAMKKPVLLGVEGEAKKLFIEEGKCGLFFLPENSNDLAEKILILKNDPKLLMQFGENGFDFVNRFFIRRNITSEFLSVLKTGGNNG